MEPHFEAFGLSYRRKQNFWGCLKIKSFWDRFGDYFGPPNWHPKSTPNHVKSMLLAETLPGCPRVPKKTSQSRVLGVFFIIILGMFFRYMCDNVLLFVCLCLAWPKFAYVYIHVIRGRGCAARSNRRPPQTQGMASKAVRVC